MAPAQRGPLTPEQLGELASATLTNSVELLRDAEGLAIFGRYPRAYSLAVLAAEEFGKHMMCFGAGGRESVDPDAWPTFWRKFLSHNPKYENAASMAMASLPPEASAQFAERFHEHVSADQKRRLGGFYVDWKDGAIVTPDSVVTEGLVSDLLSVFTTVIYSWADNWRGTDFGELFKQAESSASIVQKALLTSDPHEVVKAFRETLGPSDIEWFRSFVAERRWQVGMADPTHEYTVRNWVPDRTEYFVKAAQIIRELGRPAMFWSLTYVYLHVDLLKYWTMDEQVPETTVINRAQD